MRLDARIEDGNQGIRRNQKISSKYSCTAAGAVCHVLLYDRRRRRHGDIHHHRTESRDPNISTLASNHDLAHLTAHIQVGQGRRGGRIRNISHMQLPAATRQENLVGNRDPPAVLPLCHRQLVLIQQHRPRGIRHVDNAHHAAFMENIGDAVVDGDYVRIHVLLRPMHDWICLADKNRHSRIGNVIDLQERLGFIVRL